MMYFFVHHTSGIAVALMRSLLLGGEGNSNDDPSDVYTAPNNTSNNNNETSSSSSSGPSALKEHEVEHERDAWTTLLLLWTLIGCLLLAYYVKKFRIFWFPESAGAMLVGVIVGGVARLATDHTQLLEFVRRYEASSWTFTGW
jgi:hypothetical protein